ncbi:MAG TPA: tyrosine-type recombinase/integrase [Candidatus Bathyarchaeia archaeon]|nr:tyrosine-type recombinase/integrase [Candidatus Bathyarchaeia archaeon]
MSLVAPTLEAFFTERLVTQKNASPHTIASYRDCLKQLLAYAQGTTGIAPSKLDFSDLDATVIGGFLHHLERDGGLSARSRNVRLAAIRSLFSFAALRHPEHAALIGRVLAIPAKRGERALVSFLLPAEADALLASPDRSRRLGRRDHALLVLALQTGLRVSELSTLRLEDLHLGTGAFVHCAGKGRKERATPLTKLTITVMKDYLAERGGQGTDPVFAGPGGRPLGRDAIRRLVERHAASAARACPSLTLKRPTPHTLRHTCAMRLLESGTDIATIGLWLGHASSRTTEIYLHAHLALKERAIERTAPPGTASRRYRPPDRLLAFLEAL